MVLIVFVCETEMRTLQCAHYNAHTDARFRISVFSRKYSEERIKKDDNRGTEGSHPPFRVKGQVILCRSRSSRRSSPRFAYKWFLWALQVIARVRFKYDHIPCSF